jgi:hypothetical protein
VAAGGDFRHGDARRQAKSPGFPGGGPAVRPAIRARPRNHGLSPHHPGRPSPDPRNDMDGPRNEKELYAIAEVKPRMSMRKENIARRPTDTALSSVISLVRMSRT